jgi:thiosulfate/3-mercaptopyruvate sulfurtransferase
VLLFVDHVAAGFGVLVLGEAVPNSPRAAADAVARLDDGDRGAAADKIVRGHQAGQPGARDEHRHAGEIAFTHAVNSRRKLARACAKLSTMIPLLAVLAVSYAHPEQLVDTAWVAAHQSDANVRIIDMRQSGWDDGHIDAAVHLAPTAIRDANAPPTFLPTPTDFEKLMASLRIGDNTHVVVYDERGGIYAARLWWILNYFGHSRVSLVNGGWIKWKAEERPSTVGVCECVMAPGPPFNARPHPTWIATATDVVNAIDKPGVAIVDARTTAEIEGKDLRNIKRGGFVPSSVPVYWEDLLDPQQKTFKPADELKKIYEARGIVPSKEVIAYCQVGMRASVDLFALHLIGYDKLRNYYGAWEEWGNRDDLPIAKK